MVFFSALSTARNENLFHIAKHYIRYLAYYLNKCSQYGTGCDFMGKISYPLYIVHYPVIYLYWNWVTPRHLPWTSVWPSTILIAAFCVMMAYACLKLYDESVRAWLKKKVEI